jgi:hypothetical protein
MKYLFYLLAFISFSAAAQFSKEEMEMTEIIKVNGAYISPKLFLDTNQLKDLKLVNSTSWRKLWSDIEDSSKNIIQMYDIRLKFESKKEAQKFHKKYVGINSEFGPKIANSNVKFTGALSPMVFGSSPNYEKMMGAYGYKTICFLFVVDSYFVKIYINCKNEIKPESYQNLVDSAIKKIRSVKN